MGKEEQVLAGFREVYNKLSWLNKVKMEVSLKGYKPSEIHCVEFVGDHPDSNVTKLADAFYMTRGAISKLTKKLIEKNLIESYQKVENKKEIYFKLTKKGEEIYKLHEALHQEFKERDQAVFENITTDQFDAMLEFIESYNSHLEKEITKQNKKIT